MARRPRPWYREERDAWFVIVDGKQVPLGPHPSIAARPRQRNGKWNVPKEIDDAFLKLLTNKKPLADPSLLVGLFDEFLHWCSTERPDSYDWYETRISAFAKTVPNLRTADLQPSHVQKWISTKKSDGHKRGCLVGINRALNWAVKQRLIAENPIRGMEKPSAGRRDIFLTPAQFEKVLAAASDEPFKDLLTFCWETGCRPQEAFRLEARHVEADRCVFPEKESKGKKKKRVIYMTPTARDIVKRLCKETPEGRLFRNQDGDPWNRNNVTCRFARLRQRMNRIVLTKEQLKTFAAELKKRNPTKTVNGKEVEKTAADLQREARRKLRAKLATGPKYCLYHLRHSYCQRALKNGVDPITLAELMGHSSAAMIMRIYQHLGQDKGHMLEAAMKAAK